MDEVSVWLSIPVKLVLFPIGELEMSIVISGWVRSGNELSSLSVLGYILASKTLNYDILISTILHSTYNEHVEVSVLTPLNLLHK